MREIGHDTTFIKDKSFHNSIEWSRLNLQVNISPYGCRKFSDLQYKDCWKMHLSFMELLSPPIHVDESLSPHEKLLFFLKKVPTPNLVGEREAPCRLIIL